VVATSTPLNPMFVLWYVVGLMCVLASEILLVGALLGVGLLIRRRFRLTSATLDDLFDAWWVGFAALLPGLMLWHILTPVSWLALLLTLGLGVVGLLQHRQAVADAFAASRVDSGLMYALLAAALYVANQGLGDLTYSDSALYHMQAVMWNKTYPLVPGLANLYGPLGFNNTSLVLGAMLDSGAWNGLGHRLANGLLMQPLLARTVLGVVRLTSRDGRAGPEDVFAAGMLPGLIALSLLGRLSSYATATSTALLVLATAAFAYRYLLRAPREPAYGLFGVTLLSAAAVTLKLSAAILAAPLTIATHLWWWVRYPERRGRTLAISLGVALVVGALWTGRSLVLSGYPLFPSRVIAAPVDWRVPEEHADAEYALAAHSSTASTMLYDVVAGRDRWGWLPRWWRVSRREPFDFIVPSVVALIGLTVLVRRRRHASGADSTVFPWLAVPVGIAVMAWFFVAPEGRYAIGFFWSLAALSLAEAWRAGRATTPWRGGRRVAIAASVIAFATLVTVPLPHVGGDSALARAKGVIKQSFRLWDSRDWYRSPEPPPLEPYTTRSGLVVGVPGDRCWNAPVPCTPNPSPTLEARTPGNLRDGFRVRGTWSMQDWPFKSRPQFLQAWRESRDTLPND
jgi:hypothetical protein